MLPMLEGALDHRARGCARAQRLGDRVAGEETRRVRLRSQLALFVAGKLAEDDRLPDVPGVWLVRVPVAVEEGQQLDGPRLVAGLLEYLPDDRLARRLADVDPAARQRPGAVFADEKDLVAAEHDAAHVEL